MLVNQREFLKGDKCAFVCVYTCVFLLFLKKLWFICFVCLFLIWRERKKLDGWEDREDLEGVGGRETITKMYCMIFFQ